MHSRGGTRSPDFPAFSRISCSSHAPSHGGLAEPEHGVTRGAKAALESRAVLDVVTRAIEDCVGTAPVVRDIAAVVRVAREVRVVPEPREPQPREHAKTARRDA